MSRRRTSRISVYWIVLGGLLLTLPVGCGPPSPSRVRLQDEHARSLLDARYPEVVGQARTAEEDADRLLASGDQDGAADYETIARLHYQLAEMIDETRQLEEQVTEEQRQLDEGLARYAGHVREREELAGASEHQQVIQAAQDEAHRAFAIAEQDERRRLRRRATEMTGARMNATRALLDRTLWLEAGAEALGADAESPLARTAEHRAIRALRDAPEAIARARRLHGAALFDLRRTRSAQPPGDHDGCLEFVRAAREQDFDASLQDDGLRLLDVPPSRARALSALLSRMPNAPLLVYPRALRSALLRVGEPEVRVRTGPTEGPSLWIPGCSPPPPGR